MKKTTRERKFRPARGLLVILAVCSVAVLSPAEPAPKLKPEELVAEHLKSIGTPEALAAWKTTIGEGTGRLLVYVGAERLLPGQATFLSDGKSLRSSLRFDVSDYPAEDLSYDGKEVYVEQLSPGERSRIGQFLYQYESLVKEGLFGGTLSTAWPLLDLAGRKPRLRYNGLKNMYEQELHELRYQMRRGAYDFTIMLYFHVETFRHLATVYKLRIPDAPSVAPGRSSSGGARAEDSPRRVATLVTLEERFGEFRQVGDLTLPIRWKVRLTTEGPGAQVGLFSAASRDLSIIEWDIAFEKIRVNAPIDPRSFVLY